MTKVDTEKLKKDATLIAQICSKYDLNNKAVAKKVYAYLQERKPFGTSIGTTFSSGLGKNANIQSEECMCAFCQKQKAYNGVLCKNCMAKVINTVKSQETKKPDAVERINKGAAQNTKKNATENIKKDASVLMKDVSDVTKSAIQSGTAEAKKAAGVAKAKITEQLKDEKTQQNIKKAKETSQNLFGKLKLRWNKLSKKGKIIVSAIAVVLVFSIIGGANSGSGETGGIVGISSVSDEKSAEEIINKMYSSSDGWEITGGETFNMPVGALDTPVGRTTAYYSNQINNSGNAEVIQKYYSETVPCWTFSVHRVTSNLAENGVVMVSPYGQVFAQGMFADLPTSEHNYRIR